LAKLNHNSWTAGSSPSANATICHHPVLRSFVSDTCTRPLFRVLLPSKRKSGKAGMVQAARHHP